MRTHPELTSQAVEELLRYIPLSTLTLPIVATEDVEIGGVTVHKGESVLPVRAAANRDARTFADPDRLDFDRALLPHLTFSHGAHHCIGAALARMELQVALRSLLDRFPELRLALAPEELEWKTGKVIRSPRALPVSW
jgi:cytochrome P450